ncbi:MAG: signal recognition particle protein [Firmicutes bacterium]|nr:signal recognition particle protein [Bacillota bacterium]MDD4693538.1 signal recognition particle protein [Bacillota bacterium]
MIFENLAEKLQNTFSGLKNRGKLSEKDVELALKEVRLALLEADVNYKVVKTFTERVRTRAVGEEVLKSLTPAQQVIKIVYDELTALMGGAVSGLNLSHSPSNIMMVGLQGAGKTTTAGKLARNLKENGRRPLLVACDIYRPAAIKQLQVVGSQVGVEVFSVADQKPVSIAKAALKYANQNGYDVIIIDTAGRLHIDEDLMQELVDIKSALNPQEILFIADAMTGQDAVNVADSFNQRLDISGVILTKMDGDARGGAALSIREVVGKPIKYASFGEKLDSLEAFHPDRMTSRILGMGDLGTILEKAQKAIDEKDAQQMMDKLTTDDFNLEDFYNQMQQMKKMGPLNQLLEMVPGMNKQLKGQDLSGAEDEMKKIEAMINSMTNKERRQPDIIDASRKKRIAVGSGVKVQDVNKLLKQFSETKKMMRQFGGLATGKGKRKIRMPFFGK